MSWYGIIMRLTLMIFVIAIIVSMSTAIAQTSIQSNSKQEENHKVNNRITGFNVLSNYVEDDSGIQLYHKDGEEIKEGKKFNLGKFYRDVLKLGGNVEIIKECSKEDNYKNCIEGEYNSSEKMQNDFNAHMKGINTAISTGKEYGIKYMDLPFIKDLMAE
jgi:hypothetical protein